MLEVLLVKQDTDKWSRQRTFSNIERSVKDGRYKPRHNFTDDDIDLVMDMLRTTKGPIDDLLKSVDKEAFNKIKMARSQRPSPNK